MPGTGHLVLVGDQRARVDVGDVRGHLVAGVSHDDDEVLGLDRAGGGERVAQQ